MAGIYIHIPFCSKKCRYCDFYSVGTIQKQDDYVEAVIRELQTNKNYFEGEKLETIYFGGGTPSAIRAENIGRIIESIKNNFEIEEVPEITLEANPEDINPSYLSEIVNTGVNRVSLGVQSLSDEALSYMGRRHSAEDAILAVEAIQQSGICNISADIIFGLPGLSTADIQRDLSSLIKSGIRHISCYHLTIEDRTVFSRWYESGKLILPDQEESLKQYLSICKILSENGFSHYEISNWAKPDFESKHNSSYWKREKYLGLGASAHSYNRISRRWNVSNIDEYMNKIRTNVPAYEEEFLSEKDMYNEFIMLSLRTSDGIDLNYLKSRCGEGMQKLVLKKIEKFVPFQATINEGNIVLTEEGMFISDTIIQNLIIV